MTNYLTPQGPRTGVLTSGAPIEFAETRGPLCEYWSFEEALMCGHSSCYTIVADAEELPDDEGDRYPEHDCPKDVFLNDPITEYYGVGSEMVGLIKCPVCDARDAD